MRKENVGSESIDPGDRDIVLIDLSNSVCQPQGKWLLFALYSVLY